MHPYRNRYCQASESDPSVRILAEQVLANLFSPRGQSGRILRAAIFHMQSRERWTDRARYLYRLAATPGVEDWQLIDLPSSLTFLYPLLRLPRLVHKYGMRAP